MKALDLTLNEFDQKAIAKLCPNRKLEFNNVDLRFSAGYIYTNIEVVDLNDDFCTCVSSLEANTDSEGNHWLRKDLLEIANKINESEAMNDILGSGLCPEVFFEEPDIKIVPGDLYE